MKCALNSAFSAMTIVSFGMFRIAKAPSPPLDDGRTAKYWLEKCGEKRDEEAEVEEEEKDEESEMLGESEDEEKVEVKEDAGEWFGEEKWRETDASQCCRSESVGD